MKHGIFGYLLFWGFVLAAAAGLAIFQCANGYSVNEDKVILEDHVKTKVEAILKKVLGGEEYIVLVDITPNTDIVQEFWKKKLTSKEAEEMKKEKALFPGISLDEQQEYLPGVTFFDNIARSAAIPQAGDETTTQVTKMPVNFIKRMFVTIIVDARVSEDSVSQIRNQVTELIGVSQTRGDLLTVKKIKFKKGIIGIANYWKNILHPAFLAVAFLVLAAFFAFGPLKDFFRNLLHVLEVFKVEADARIKARSSMEVGRLEHQMGVDYGAYGPVHGVGPKQKSKEGEGLFQFVTTENVDNLIHLIEGESAETVAIIVNYLDKDCASHVFSALPAEKQAEVAEEVLKTKQYSGESVKAVEKKIQEKIDFLIGGEKHFIEIFNNAEEETQKHIMQAVAKSNPQLANKLRKQIFVFEDIMKIDESSLKKIIRECGAYGVYLAIALKDVSAEIKNRVLGVLSEGAQEILAQEMDLSGIVSPKRIKEEQRRIVEIILRLEKAGEIIINR